MNLPLSARAIARLALRAPFTESLMFGRTFIQPSASGYCGVSHPKKSSVPSDPLNSIQGLDEAPLASGVPPVVYATIGGVRIKLTLRLELVVEDPVEDEPVVELPVLLVELEELVPVVELLRVIVPVQSGDAMFPLPSN